MNEQSPIETYRNNAIKINDSLETSPAQLLAIIKNPSEEVVAYLKNKTEKVKATVVSIERKNDTQKFDRDVQGNKYKENVTFDTVVVKIEGLSAELPIEINSAVFEATANIHPKG